MKQTKPTGTISIIPVDGDEVLGRSLTDFLLTSKYFMTEAQAEFKTFTYFREIQPNVIITDQRKQEIAGPELHKISAKKSDLTQAIAKCPADLFAQNQRNEKESAERQAQENLVLIARNELERTVNALPDLITIVDRNHQITSVNQSMQKKLDRSLAEIIGQDCPICKDEFTCLHQELMANRESRTVEIYNRDFDAHYSLDIIPNYSRDGELVGSVCVLRDITELKKTIKEKEILQAQLLHTNKLDAVGQLASGIAHEINTPTQYIISNVGFINDAFTDFKYIIDTIAGAAQENKLSTALLQNALQKADWTFLETEIPKAIKQSQEGLDKVTSIVRAMKEFTNPCVKGARLIDINHLIETTLTVSRNVWKYNSELILDLTPEIPGVTCLADEIGQVLLNLLINSAQSIAEKLDTTLKGGTGQITIKTEVDEPCVLIHVTDTGCGIPESAGAKIFDPFFTTKEVGKGTGQGLAISYDVITRKHGGSLTFTSVLGEGTTFTIRLPIKKEPG